MLSVLAVEGNLVQGCDDNWLLKILDLGFIGDLVAGSRLQIYVADGRFRLDSVSRASDLVEPDSGASVAAYDGGALAAVVVLAGNKGVNRLHEKLPEQGAIHVALFNRIVRQS